MSRGATSAGALVVLAGPTVVAFSRGGYFDEARLWAGAAAWLLVAAVAVAGPRALAPPTRPGRLAVAGLAGLAAWTGVSLLWAPAAGPAVDGFQRALLYLGALLAAVALLRPPPVRRAVEPALLAGIAVVVAYALSERLLPGLVTFDVSFAAGNRLNEPLTYWNALGALCAIGLVLAAGLVARPDRPGPLRMAAAAAAAPVGLALYLTFSRGALGAAAGGLAVLVAVAPSLRTLAAAALAAAAAAVPAAATIALPDVEAQGGSSGHGLAMIAVLAAAMAGAAALAPRVQAAPRTPRRWLRTAAVTALAAALAVLLAVALTAERRPAALPERGTPGRLTSTQSNRYAYWEVAVRAWADHPLEGVGSGGFAAEWRREREIAESVRDAHSLYLETAAELGLAGVCLLAALIAGAAGCARRAGPAAAGSTAALAAYGLHAGLDWDWEMSALTLIAVVLLGALAVSGRSGSAPAARPPSPRRAT